MLQQIDSSKGNTLVYELDETITKNEIAIIEKGIESILVEFDKVNLIICIDVKRHTLSAMIKELQVALKYWNKIHKIAYVADKKHWKTLIAIDNLFAKFSEKYFDVDDMDNAWTWITENED